MILQGNALAERFAEHFDIVLAKTDAERDQVYKVRGEVYCREFGYEPEENCPGGLEQDEFDTQSVHCLIRHRKLNVAAGCIRLIMAPTYSPNGSLPFEHFCNRQQLAFNNQSRRQVTEISRLAVRSEFRKPPLDGLSDSERQIFPLVTIALFMAAPALSGLTGRSNNFAMMEPRLVRLLKRSSGFDFTQIGDLVDYHGWRAAFHITTENMLKNMHPHLNALYQLVLRTLKADFQPHHWAFLAPTFSANAAAARPVDQPLPVGSDIVYSPV